MEQDPTEVLREIAAMQGTPLREELEQQEELHEQDQEGERKGQEEQAEINRQELLAQESEAPEEEDSSIESRYAALLAAHNQLSAQMLEMQARGYPVASPQAPVPSVVAPPPEVPSPPPVATFQLNEQLLEKALVEDDPRAMKQVITGLIQHMETMVSSVRDQTREAVLRDIPAVAQNVARQQLAMMKAVEGFYSDNQDLAPFQHIVGAVANEVTSREPGLTISEALQKTEVEVRRRLGLKKAAMQVPVDRQPAFPKAKTTRKPSAPVLTGLRADIAAMQNARP
jgi:hypothetical protein